MVRFEKTLCALALALLRNGQVSAPQSDPEAIAAAVKTKSSLKDSTDGWFDLSGYLKKPRGFFPAVMPITEPAVGYGVAAFPIFLRPRTAAGAQGYARPNISIAGGLYTSNGSWGALAGDSSYWKNGRLETMFAGGYTSINLKYYDDAGGRKGDPRLGYNLSMMGGVARGRFRIRKSNFHLGIRYLFLQVNSSPKSERSSVAPPERLGRTDRLGAPSLSLSYDSRDNVLTPTKGPFTESTYSYFDPIFGGTINYQRFDQLSIAYVRFNPRLILGVYTNASFTFGDPVFYARPYVSLRGIPAMRYQRQNMAEGELELRCQFWKRLSVVGFGGPAVVWNSSSTSNRAIGVGAGGAGFRYLLARKFGLHYGVDVARGPEGPAVYFQFGSAWVRP